MTTPSWQGEVELLEASWDLNNGRTVKLRIIPERHSSAHPFEGFVRNRGGRVGARFFATFKAVDLDTAVFESEVMLAGGGNVLGQGSWVKFWLDDLPHGHPFGGYHGRSKERPGTMFMMVLVELADDDTPKADEQPANRKRLSQSAALMCMDTFFHQWLSETVQVRGRRLSPQQWAADDMAARWMRWTLEIESRSELDRDERAANRFHTEIRIPFRNWMQLGGRGHDRER